MKNFLLALCLFSMAYGAQAQYQMENSDFEAWTASSGEPDHWHGFKSAKGGLAGSAQGKLAKSTDTRPGSTGTYSAVITAGSVFGITNNGTMTTGQLQAGSMSASNTANHAEMDKTSTATDKNDDKFYMPLTGHPDALKCWVKFAVVSGSPYASVSAVITDGSYYQDPEDKAYTNKVAVAKNTSIAPCDWTELTVPFDYDSYLSNNTEPAAILCTFGTNAKPGKGTSGDAVYIDDVELVYWHALSALSYEGATLNFSENTTNYDLSTVLYDETKLSYTIKGRAATATKNYNEETHILTIRVEGEDITSNSSSFTEYTIQFAVPQVVSSKVYSEDLYVTMGTETADKQVANVVVETLDNGNINFMLKNFVLIADENAMPVGNIAVNNIKIAADGSFTFKGGIAITEGDDTSFDFWLGPAITEECGGSVPLDLSGQFIGDDHVVVYISIDIAQFVGYPVEVHLGYDVAPMAVNATAQYGTFCAPFDVEVPAGVTAYTVPSIDGNLLNLQEVGVTIPANTPVVLYAESGLEKEMFFGLAKEGNPVADVLTGVYENTVVPVGSYVLQYLNGKVGFYLVAEGKQPTLGANRCYLTVPASGVKAFYLDGNDATGISNVDANVDANEVIYNIAGQRINELQKGINIVNGKKILK